MSEDRVRNADRRRGLQFAAVGAFLCALAVILAAAGDHLVAGEVSAARLHIYDIANRFQIFQGIGLVLAGFAIAQWGRRRSLCLAAILMFFGVITFSGALYLLAVGASQGWAICAPIGGSALILAWLSFAYGLWQASRRELPV